MFDSSKTITVHGTVKKFQFTNPHSWLIVMVTDAGGNAVEWGFEAEGPSTLLHAGILPKSSARRQGDHYRQPDARRPAGRSLELGGDGRRYRLPNQARRAAAEHPPVPGNKRDVGNRYELGHRQSISQRSSRLVIACLAAVPVGVFANPRSRAVRVRPRTHRTDLSPAHLSRTTIRAPWPGARRKMKAAAHGGSQYRKDTDGKMPDWSGRGRGICRKGSKSIQSNPETALMRHWAPSRPF